MDNTETMDMEQLHARLYESVTNTIKEVRSGMTQLELDVCNGCKNLDKCELAYVDVLNRAFSECGVHCGVTCSELGGKRIVQMTYDGEVFMQVDPITKDAIQKCTDDMCNTVFYHRLFGVEE